MARGNALVPEAEAKVAREALRKLCEGKLQKKVAEELGVSQSTISAILGNTQKPSRETANRIFGVANETAVAGADDADRVRDASVVRPRDKPGRRLRGEQLHESERNSVPDLQGSGRRDDVVRLEAKDKVIKLPKSQVGEFELQNQARRLSRLEQLKIVVRTCFKCQAKFEVVDRRFCPSCRSQEAAVLSGQEVFYV